MMLEIQIKYCSENFIIQFPLTGVLFSNLQLLSYKIYIVRILKSG